MGTLTGQQIKDTYEGLLKLEDSTTGITSTYQPIQDGLGNNTGSRISTKGILSPNLPGFNNLKPDYMGLGFSPNPGTAPANSQNRTLYIPFYDTGLWSYSAISYNVNTITSTSDVVNAAIYTMQQVPTIGVAPKDLIMSGITLISNSTGLKTTTLPSTLSFSGTGGYYVMAVIISNGGVTPTIRYTPPNAFLNHNQSYATSLGLYLNVAGTSTNVGSRAQNLANANALFILNNLSSFQTSYSTSDITTNISTSVGPGGGYGFALNVI
jgi:hypothetical protein